MFDSYFTVQNNIKMNFISENIKNWKTLLALPIITYLFFNTYISKFSELCGVIFNKWEENDSIRSWIFLVVFLMGLIYFFYKILYNKSYPTIDSILFFGITMILHFSLFRSREEFKYFRLFSSQIYLVDLLLFCILFFFTGYKYQGERLKKGESSIIEDNPDLISEDILHRKILVEEISKQVNHTISEKAVSIAIQSEWGYGKTVFLKFLKLELEKNKDNIIIEFNPWKVEREQNSLKRFFDALESELKKYDSGIQKQLVAYSNKLFEVSSEENVFSKLLKMLFSSFLSLDEGLDQQYKNINESIKRIGKRIIVLIDDLDRLSAPELIDVIRLIRNTGDFTNTVFIAAFDRNYVI